MASSQDREWTKDFIKLYESAPCLWQINSKAHKDDGIKEEAYNRLIEKFREIDPQANKERVEAEINRLRSHYTEELEKVLATKSEFTGIETYEPDLWYFPLMRFLDKEVKAEDSAPDDEESRPSCSSNLNLRHEDDFHDLFGRMVAMKLRNIGEDQRLLVEKMVNDIVNDATSGKLTEKHCLVNGSGEVVGDGSEDDLLRRNYITSTLFHSLDLEHQQETNDDVEMEEDN